MQLLSTKKNKLLLLLPTCLVYVVYIILPILVSLYYSFTKYSGISKPRLYGLKNYIRLLDDPYFWIALKNTAIILGISILLLGIGAFFVAMLLNQPMRGVNVCKALIFAPAIIASIIAGVIWGYLLDPVTGLVNNVLRAIGLDKLALEWIGGKTLSPYSIAFVYFWQQAGYIAAIYLAGLKTIPHEMMEAAAVDGTNFWQRLLYVTIPALRDTFVSVGIPIITGSMKIFETVQQLTGGGPTHYSETLVTYAYNTTLQEQMVLKLSVQQESVVYTRGTGTPADEAKVESMDFLIFNHDGKIVYHQHPVLEWTGNEYKTTVNIPSATGEHTLYLIANYPKEAGTIHTLQDLESRICTSTKALVKPPFVMATRRITLSSLNMIAIRNAMESDGSNGFSLKRNVAKFSVGVADNNFELISINWLGCPVSASVLADVDYTSPSTLSVSSLAPSSNPIYLYQIRKMGLDAHKGFHIVVHGKYTAADGTEREGYYKLRLCTIDDATGEKVPLTSIVGNDYYKLNIRSVTGFGAWKRFSNRA